MSLKIVCAACVLLAIASPACAISLPLPCTRPADPLFSPGNPGATDPVAIWVTVNEAPPSFTPDRWFLLSSLAAGPTPSSIMVDLIYTTDPTRYPTYRIVDVYGDAPVGTVGPYGPGDYTVNITLRYFDAIAMTLIPLCADHPSVQSDFIVAAQPGPAEVVSVIEFYNAKLDHYFITEDPHEIVDLDTGVHAGWVRTGLGFRAYAPLHGDDNRGRPVARYYGPPSAGLDSHFYTWSNREIIGMRDKGLLDVWGFEGSPVFEIPTPDTATGTCQPGTVPVYRLWNRRTDSGHRYTIDAAVKQVMIARGWVPEGYGPESVFMCALLQ